MVPETVGVGEPPCGEFLNTAKSLTRAAHLTKQRCWHQQAVRAEILLIFGIKPDTADGSKCLEVRVDVAGQLCNGRKADEPMT